MVELIAHGRAIPQHLEQRVGKRKWQLKMKGKSSEQSASI